MFYRLLLAFVIFSTQAEDVPLAQIDLKDVLGVAMNSTGSWVACATKDKRVHLWNVGKKEIVALPELCGEEPFTIAISPDDKWIAVGTFGTGNNEVDLWDVQSRKILHRIKADWRGVYQVAFTPDSTRVVVGGFLKKRLSALVFEIASGKEVKSFRTETYDACAPVSISSDGKWIATSGEDGIMQVREMLTGKTVFQKHQNSCFLLQFSDDGTMLIGSGTADEELYCWAVKDWSLRVQKIKTFCSYRGALSRDGRFALGDSIGGNDATLITVDNGNSVHQFTLAKDEYVTASAFSGNSKRFALAGNKGTLSAWTMKRVYPENK